MTDDIAAARLLKSSEAGALFGVAAGTVVRWGKEGHLTPVPAQGGHYLFRESEVRALLAKGTQPRQDAA